jgi:hypothetical protein
MPKIRNLGRTQTQRQRDLQDVDGVKKQTPVGDAQQADVKKADTQRPVDVSTAGNPQTTAGDRGRLNVDAQLKSQGLNRADLQNGVGQVFAAAAKAAGGATAAAKVEPSIQKLYQDPDFSALHQFCVGAASQIQKEGREWDTLGQIKNFAAAAAFVTKGEALPGGIKAKGDTPLKRSYTGSMEQRAMCNLLMMLMPKSMRTEREVLPDGSRGFPQSLLSALPDNVVSRVDDGFKLKAGDLPKLNPHLTEPFTDKALLDNIFRPGQQGVFLAPKKYCPGAFLQDRKDLQAGKDKADQAGHDGDPIFVKIEDVFTDNNGQKMARVTVPAQHKYRNGDDGGFHQHEQFLGQVDHVIDTKGQPVLGKDGKPQDILIPVDAMANYLLDPGQVRGSGKLDLKRSRDDRMLALCFTEELKSAVLTDSNGITKNVFDWLQEADARTPRQDIERIKDGAWRAAWNAVTKFASHPRRTHFAITVDNEPGLSKQAWNDRNGWKKEALEVLNDCGLRMQDSGERYARSADQIGERWENHQISWTSNFLERGFEGGTLDCYGLADAFDRLSATFLAPMGIVSMADIAEGHGASVGRTLAHPDESGVIQAGIPKKVKPNELIAGFDLQKSSGVGPSAGVYWINFGGYVNIDAPSGKQIDFAKDAAHADEIVDELIEEDG